MGLISEYRSSLENPQTPLSFPAEWLLDIFNGGRTDSGIRVSELTALQVTTVFCCVELKAGAIGALDLRIYEKMVNADGRLNRRIDHDNDLWDLLHEEPNDEMSSFTMRKTVQAHRMLWGNGYVEIQRDGGDRPVALWPRNPARMKLRRASANMVIRGELVKQGGLFYATTEGMETAPIDSEEAQNEGHASEREILPADVLHMPGLALDGRIGQDVIQLARNAVGLALATERFGGKFFGNGALGYGIFKIPGNLAPEDFEAFKREVQEAWGGENVNRPLVLQGGEEYQSTSTKPNEGQFLESRMFQITEICRVMGNVPPHMVGVTEKTSRANVEQIGQEFLTFALRPDLVCWTQEIDRKLFPRASMGRNAGKKFGVFFDTWPLVTPAAADLRAFIQAMVQWGVWQPNDARARLNDNPLDTPAADTTWMQINMAPVDQLFETPALPGAAADAEEDEPGNEGADPAGKKGKAKRNRSQLLVQRICRAYSRLFRDAWGRIAARSEADIADFRRIFLPVLVSIGEELETHAAELFGAAASPDGLEDSRFLAGYLETMQHRARNEKWAGSDGERANGHGDEIAQRELGRAVRALAVEAWRSAATAAAKEGTEVIAQ
jgi:HK97 family phage portal protein